MDSFVETQLFCMPLNTLKKYETKVQDRKQNAGIALFLRKIYQTKIMAVKRTLSA